MRVEADGIRIGYDDVGEGEPLVLLHGFPLERRLFAPQLRALAGQARCIAPDLRGFGESTLAPPVSMDRYADDVAALLDALGIARAVVGGVSMGAYVAFALWRRHPGRVRALLLAGTRANADDEAARARRQETMALARSRGSGAVADQMLPGLLGVTTRAERPEIVRAVHAMAAAAPVEGVVAALGAMMTRPDSTATLATIEVPVLIVVGAEDTIAPPDVASAMQAAVAGSRLEVLPGAGHLANIERPAAFNHVVSDFLDAVQRRGGRAGALE